MSLGPGLRAGALAAVIGVMALPIAAAAQLDSAQGRPFVAGGLDDPTRMRGMFGAISLGGYLEANGFWEREDGATTELGVELTRWNLLASTQLGRHVRIFSEVEFEEGGEEIVVEVAQVDLLLHSAANARGGILLLPLGRFNLAHDGPRNELPRRPSHATDLLGVAIAQPGLGAFGQLAAPGGSRLTYEAYAVTGYFDGLLYQSSEGTRLPAGRFNPEDGNASPAFVGRTEWSPSRRLGIGLSGYHGAWNTFRIEGLDVEERYDVAVGVLDAHVEVRGLVLSAEGATVRVDMPDGLAGLFATRQAGLYAQVARGFGRAWIRGLPDSWWTVATRIDVVDFDRELAGDSFRSLTLGVNFRPIPETAIKLAWMRGQTRDRFNNPGDVAQIQLGLASYF